MPQQPATPIYMYVTPEWQWNDMPIKYKGVHSGGHRAFEELSFGEFAQESSAFLE